MDPIKIDAVTLVREIRDRHFALLQEKSPEEVLAFYHHEAALVNAEAAQFLRIRNAIVGQQPDDPEWTSPDTTS